MSKNRKRRLKRHSYQKPSAAPVSITPFPWDRGADGPAARAMESVTEQRGEIDPETGKEINPNGVTGVRRISVAENYHRNGHLTLPFLAACIHVETCPPPECDPAIEVCTCGVNDRDDRAKAEREKDKKDKDKKEDKEREPEKEPEKERAEPDEGY